MDHSALSWTGDRFVRISGLKVILPEGRKLLDDGYSIDLISPDDLAGMTAAMRVNPTVRAFIAPGILAYGHADPLDRIVHESHPDPEWRAAYSPKWHPSRLWGTAWKRKPGQRAAVIYVRAQERELVGTTYHELFHTVAGNLPADEWKAVEAACSPYRDLNATLPSDHPEKMKGWTLEPVEEPAAYLFERFAIGLPPRYGFKLPWRVRRTFKGSG